MSAFYFESPEKQMYMNASIWTRSKFMGMSIGVALIGKGMFMSLNVFLSAFAVVDLNSRLLPKYYL